MDNQNYLIKLVDEDNNVSLIMLIWMKLEENNFTRCKNDLNNHVENENMIKNSGKKIQPNCHISNQNFRYHIIKIHYFLHYFLQMKNHLLKP